MTSAGSFCFALGMVTPLTRSLHRMTEVWGTCILTKDMAGAAAGNNKNGGHLVRRLLIRYFLTFLVGNRSCYHLIHLRRHLLVNRKNVID